MINDYIPGFQIIGISGRENLSYHVESSDRAGNRDGQNIRSKKLRERIITVRYMMRSENKYERNEKFRLLNMLLYRGHEDLPIYFSDMPQYLFYGQVSAFDEVPDDKLNLVTSFDIYCQDPYIYSFEEKVLSTVHGTLERDVDGALIVENPGSASTRFELETTFSKENAYYSVITNDQWFAMGDPEEADAISTPQDKLVVDEGMTDLGGWTLNEVEPPIHDGKAIGGFKQTTNGTTLSTAVNEVWEEGDHWHGPSMTIPFERDSLNQNFAENFKATVSYAMKSTGHKVAEAGRVIIGILDQNDEFMAWADMRDGTNKYSQLTGNFWYEINDIRYKGLSDEFYFKDFEGSLTIEKNNDMLYFVLDHPEGKMTDDQITKLARDVIAGKYGNDPQRKELLGAKYDAVQARVNEMEIERLADEVLAGKWGNWPQREQRLGSMYTKVQNRVNERVKGSARKTFGTGGTFNPGKTIRFQMGVPQFSAQGRVASKLFIWVGRLRELEFYNNFEIDHSSVKKYYSNGMNNVTNLIGPNDRFTLNTESGQRFINDERVYIGIVDGSDVSLELAPGTNFIATENSTWYTGAEDVVIRFRPKYY